MTELRAARCSRACSVSALVAHGNRPAFALVRGLGEELVRRYDGGDVELIVRLI